MQSSEETRSRECFICYEDIRDPRRLPCGHSFCTWCLQRLLVDYFNRVYLVLVRKFRCPICRAHVSVSVEGALGFPRDDQIVDGLANRPTDDVRLDEDEISNDETQSLLRVVPIPADLARRMIYRVDLGEHAVLNNIVQDLPRRVPVVNDGVQDLPRRVPVVNDGVQDLPRDVQMLNAMFNVPNRTCSGEDCLNVVLLLVIEFLICGSLMTIYQMNKNMVTCASEKDNCRLSEQILQKRLPELIDDADKAENSEKKCLSEKEELIISEQNLTRQLQELIAKQKRDSLLVERMQKYIDKIQYAKQPALSKTFQLQPAESRAAVALTLIDGRLLVANSVNGDLKLRDTYSVTKESDWATIPSDTVAGMGLCLKNGNVFVSTWNNKIFRFDRNGQILGQWPVETSSAGVISVTNDCKVVLAVRDNSKKILTYSIYGELISEVEMIADISESRLLKAVQISNDHFLVSYGEDDDRVHGIDIIDANGQTLKSHDWMKGAGTVRLRDPRDFVVDAYGNVLVADSGNGRIILLDSELKFQRELVSTEHGLNHPLGIVLNERETLLYVADNKREPSWGEWTDGQIIVFKIR